MSYVGEYFCPIKFRMYLYNFTKVSLIDVHFHIYIQDDYFNKIHYVFEIILYLEKSQIFTNIIFLWILLNI